MSYQPLAPSSTIKADMLRGAYQMQTVLRAASAFGIVFPLFIFGMVCLGLLHFGVLFAAFLADAMIALPMIVNVSHEARGWWMRPGPILTSGEKTNTLLAEEWLKLNTSTKVWVEVSSGCYKFYSKRHARLFHLRWQ